MLGLHVRLTSAVYSAQPLTLTDMLHVRCPAQKWMFQQDDFALVATHPQYKNKNIVIKREMALKILKAFIKTVKK